MGPGLKLTALRWLGHQHYIRRGRDRVIRAFHPPDASASIPFEVPFFGMRYAGNLNNYIDWSVFMYGAYARYELYALRDVAAALSKAASAPLCFYDVGANVGQHSLFMSQHAGRVYSFEPFAEVRNQLLEKIARNHCANITVFPVGLGDVNCDLDFFEPPGENRGAGSFVAGEASVGKVATKLPVRCGDDFLSSNGLPKIDILKMDVEGFEMRVLSGLQQRLRQDRPAILMEISQATRSEMGSEARFRKNLYEDAVIVELACTSISSSYRIKPFRFESSSEILIVPGEKTAWLPLAGWH
jgi:FkbM family methyltransferase